MSGRPFTFVECGGHPGFLAVTGLDVKTYPEIKDIQHKAIFWCAYCGLHGDHQSGWCPRIKHDTQDQRPRLSPSLAHVKAMADQTGS